MNKKFREYLEEDVLTDMISREDPSIAREARARRLQYAGFGRYINPKNGDVTHIVTGNNIKSLTPITQLAKKPNLDKKGSYSKNQQILNKYHKDITKKIYEITSNHKKNLIKDMAKDTEQHSKLLSDHQIAMDNMHTQLDPRHSEKLHSIWEYSATGYDSINRYLYQLKGLHNPLTFSKNDMKDYPNNIFLQPYIKNPIFHEYVKHHIKNLDHLITNNQIPFETHVYHGCRRINDKKINIGDVITKHGYMSTSLDPQIPFKFTENENKNKAIVQLRVPKGSKGFYLHKDITNHPDEKELLLPRNSRMIVKDIKNFSPKSITLGKLFNDQFYTNHGSADGWSQIILADLVND